MNQRHKLTKALILSCALHALAVGGLLGFGAFRAHIEPPEIGFGQSVIALTLVSAPARPAAVVPPVAPPTPVLPLPAPVEQDPSVVEEPLPDPAAVAEAAPVVPEPEPPAEAPPFPEEPRVTESIPAMPPPSEPPPVVAEQEEASGAPLPGVEDGVAYETEIRPVYPMSARMRGEEGSVTVLVTLNASARVEKAEVRTSSGHPALDRAALEAVKRARFKTRGVRSPDSRQVLLTFRFRLLDE